MGKFEILTAVLMKIQVFYAMTLRRLLFTDFSEEHPVSIFGVRWSRKCVQITRTYRYRRHVRPKCRDYLPVEGRYITKDPNLD